MGHASRIITRIGCNVISAARLASKQSIDGGTALDRSIDLLGVSPLVFALRTLVILTRLPEPLIALRLLWFGPVATPSRMLKIWLTR